MREREKKINDDYGWKLGNKKWTIQNARIISNRYLTPSFDRKKWMKIFLLLENRLSSSDKN